MRGGSARGKRQKKTNAGTAWQQEGNKRRSQRTRKAAGELRSLPPPRAPNRVPTAHGAGRPALVPALRRGDPGSYLQRDPGAPRPSRGPLNTIPESSQVTLPHIKKPWPVACAPPAGAEARAAAAPGASLPGSAAERRKRLRKLLTCLFLSVLARKTGVIIMAPKSWECCKIRGTRTVLTVPGTRKAHYNH